MTYISRYVPVWLSLLLLPVITMAQISGTVEGTENGKTIPLPGASLYWEGSEIGTVTDEKGQFSIEKPAAYNTLVVSFLGFESQSKIIISRKGTVNFKLVARGSELNSVDVVGKVDATTVDLKKADLTYRIDSKELRKAACCNLSESFETNASVDVAFTDAVTGQRQIEMLGLAGKYALIQRENIPFARGLNANTGLTYIPGPFVESLQLTKGLSSVINGYESITGQINVEFYKPETGPRFSANAFLNQGGRAELNLFASGTPEENSFAGILAHASTVPFAQDRNGDGFADMPLRSQINLMPRWHWRGKDNNGWEGQIGVGYVGDKSEGGQILFLDNGADTLDTRWGYTSDATRIEVFGKSGYVFKSNPNRSFGIIYNFSNHNRSATFGNRSYEGGQNGAYLNTIYQDILGSTFHKFRTGISIQADWVKEDLFGKNREVNFFKHARNEVVPGAYFEYSYEPGLRFTMVGGIRTDYNLYFNKFYITPRVNLRYMPSENTTLRLGGGRGQRTANVIGENLNILASSRELFLDDADTLSPEIAWNTGASVSQNILIGDRKMVLTVDAFLTWFSNKLVTDLDYDEEEAYFQYAKGSRSFSLLGQVDYELFRNFDVRLAYKYLDSREQFIDGLDQSYLMPEHRAFINFAYAAGQTWKLDLTLNWFGKKRLPITAFSLPEFQQPEFSDDFFTLNAQVRKNFKGGWEVYLGVDNLLDFRQDNPIVNAENPFDPYFDSNFTWGPVFGRNIYAGVNFSLEKKNN